MKILIVFACITLAIVILAISVVVVAVILKTIRQVRMAKKLRKDTGKPGGRISPEDIASWRETLKDGGFSEEEIAMIVGDAPKRRKVIQIRPIRR